MSDVAAPQVSAEINVQDLATLVAALNRFLTRLANIAPFQKAGLGLAEWSALSIIANRDGINNRQLANVLGVSAQRINQITDSLKSASLVSLSLASDDARKKVIAVTPEGSARLKALNTELQPIIAAALGKRPKSLGRVNTMMRKSLMHIVTPPDAERLTRKQRRRDRAGKSAASTQ